MANQITGTNAPDSLQGGAGDDEIFGFDGADTLRGGAGADYLQGGKGIDQLFGEDGNDTLDGRTSADSGDSLDGGAGNDNIASGDFADTLLGGDGDDTLSSAGGNDSLDGGAGNDNMNSGAGNDTLFGGLGNDTLSGQTFGGDKLFQGGDGADFIFGGTGNDTIDGGAGNDSINTGSGATLVLAGDGDDTVAGAGNDTVDGGIGNDSIFSVAGNDQLSGGDGNDTVIGAAGNDTLGGGAGNDSLYGGGGGADRLFGDGGDDTLSTQGGSGATLLDGGAGNDSLYGGSGNDTLVVGNGYDEAYGGEGNDTYQIDGRTFFIYDEGGANDTAIVSADWVKLPGSIETVQYVNGARALPYWIDALLPGDANGTHFAAMLGAGKTYQFGFSNSLPTYDPYPSSDGLAFTPFTEAQKAFARVALAYVSTVVGISFVETTTLDQPNTIVFANNAPGSDTAGYAYYPGSGSINSDVFLNWEAGNNTNPSDGDHSALVFIHEIGHAIGLKHPFEQDGGASTVLPSQEDVTQWTVMSYNKDSAQYHLAYSALDIAALQYLYGPNPTARAGNDTYTLSAATSNFIWDGAGTDAIDGSALTQNLVLSLDPGEWSYIGSKSNLITSAGQITVNFGTSIENATGGSGADRISGTSVANALAGGAGDDTLLGGDGNDTLSGGNGNDSLTGGAGDDALDGGAGTDIAVYGGASSAYTVTGNRLSATISGADGTDVLTSVEKLRFSDGLFDLAAPAGATLGGNVYAWKNHALLEGVTASAATGSGTAASVVTGSDGRFSLPLDLGTYSLQGSRAATDSGGAINSADALAALRIAVGINPNTGTSLKLSPYQLIAADANEDGQVNSADALAILRMAVKAPSAPAQKWIFVNESLDLWNESAAGPTLTRTAAAWQNPSVAVQAETSANLVGVLLGDVNGTWLAPAGSQLLADSYFQAVGTRMNEPTDVFGF